jgi:DNA-binding GntR family transcriptional regulator
MPKRRTKSPERALHAIDRKGKDRSAGAAAQRGPTPVEDEIYQLLTQAIIAKRIRPGSRIREAALAAQFKVSRARVRRVLTRLAELDVVKFRLNFGAFVHRPSPEESQAVFRTRRVLEAETVGEAARCCDAHAINELLKFVENETEAYARYEQGLTGVSSGFHVIVAEMSGNFVLAKILNQLVHRCVLIQALYERQSDKTICLIEEHAEIVEMIRQRRVADAVAAMERHIDHIEGSLDYPVDAAIDERVMISVD